MAEGVAVKAHEKRGTYGDDERLAGWQLGNETRDREAPLQRALVYIRDSNGDVNCRPGYAATWAAPGSGKTHLLDAIVRETQTRNDMRDRFVPIPLTFNGKMNGAASGMHGLLARIVYAHFVGVLPTEQSSKPLEVAARVVKRLGDDVPVSNVIDAIKHDFATAAPSHVTAVDVKPVLLVDELRLAGDVRAVYDAVTELAAGLSCRVLFTALDIEALNLSPSAMPSTFARDDPGFVVTKSNKAVSWLPLPRLHTDDWEAESVQRQQLLLARWIAMAGGHPRTIAAVRLAFAEVTLLNNRSALELLSTIAGRVDVYNFALAWDYLVPAFTGMFCMLGRSQAKSSLYLFARTCTAVVGSF